MVERGPYVSYANCGLPYHVGGVIQKESSLLVASESAFRNTFAVDCRTNCEAVAISPVEKTVDLRNVEDGRGHHRELRQAGAVAWRADRSGRRCRASICPACSRCGRCPTRGRSANGSRRARRSCRAWTGTPASRPCGPRQRAVVDRRRVHRAGDGGEPGASRLRRDAASRCSTRSSAPLDREMARLVEQHVEQHGIRLALSDGVAGVKQAGRQPGGADAVGQGASGRHRDPGARRASGHYAGESRGAGNRGARRHPRRRAHAHQRPATSSRSATPSRSRTS